MKQADSLLLNALKAAIHNEKAMLGVLPQETQTELLRQAVRHGVLPLVLDACGNALKAARQMAFCQTAEQILKTQVFLQLYSKLREMKLHPLVLKGPVCAALYPKPELAAVLGCRIYWAVSGNLTAYKMLYCGSAAAQRGRVSIRLNRHFTCPAVRSF